MLHFKLRVNLRPLVCNCRRLGFIEGAALDELHHLLMALHFLLEQRLRRRLLFCYDLLDLCLLRIAEIQIISEESHHRAAKEIAATVRSARTLSYGDSSHQHDRQGRQRNPATNKFHNLSCEHSPSIGKPQIAYSHRNTFPVLWW